MSGLTIHSSVRRAQPGLGAARIGAPGSALVVPAASPYEWQLLCEHLVAATRQRRAVRLRIGGVDCVAHGELAGVRRCCSGCGRAPLRVSLRMAWRDLCLGCARSWFTAEPEEVDASTGPAALVAPASMPHGGPQRRQ